MLVKSLMKASVAVAMMAGAVVVSSCGSDKDYFDSNDSFKESVKAYQENFVKKYGEVDPNQSWDFTKTSANARVTRGGDAVMVPTLTWERKEITNASVNNYWQYSADDLDEVKEKVYDTNIQAQKWPYKYAEINLHPTYAHHNTNTAFYVAVGLEYTFNGKSYTTAPNHNKNAQTTVGDEEISMRLMSKRWYAGWYYPNAIPNSGTYNSNFNSWTHINTYGLKSATSYNWWVGYYSTSSDQVHKTNIETTARCKFFTVESGRQYVAFDCDGNGDFSDLICWIEIVPQEVVVVEKRYMVEDLGTTDDFDFNDIVFDVVDNNGEQECIVRALGGTLDIEINVGGTSWRKSDKYTDFTQMLNTLDPEYTQILNKEKDSEIARFKIEDNDWNPDGNNVSVTVYPTEYSNIRLPFPEEGEVPFMVAVKTTKMWMMERNSVKDVPGWFADAE